MSSRKEKVKTEETSKQVKINPIFEVTKVLNRQ